MGQLLISVYVFKYGHSAVILSRPDKCTELAAWSDIMAFTCNPVQCKLPIIYVTTAT